LARVGQLRTAVIGAARVCTRYCKAATTLVTIITARTSGKRSFEKPVIKIAAGAVLDLPATFVRVRLLLLKEQSFLGSRETINRVLFPHKLTNFL